MKESNSQDPKISIENQVNKSLNSSKGKAKRNIRKFKCKECRKSLSSKQSLREHQYFHTNIKPYTCSECNKSFRHGSQFTNHKKTHIADSELSWPSLTFLLQHFKEKTDQPFLIIEKVQIPRITVPQEYKLPSFEQI